MRKGRRCSLSVVGHKLREMRPLLKIIIAQAAVFLALLGVTEGVVRVYYPDIQSQNLDGNLFDPFKYGETYGYKAHAQGTEFGTTYVTDEYGFRIHPKTVRADTHERMVVLGDSVSVGIGVASDETYPHLLQDKFPNQRVFNASVTGYGIADYPRVLEKIAADITPNTVIIGLCLNDTAPTSQANIVAMIHQRPTTSAVTPDATRYPNPIVRWLRHVNDRYLEFNDVLKTYSRTYLLLKSMATDSSRDYFSADVVMYKEADTLHRLISEFSRLKELADVHHTSLVLIIFPYEYQLRVPSEESRVPQRIIQKAGVRAGVQIYDVYDDLLESLASQQIPSKSLYLFNDPMHFNARGHRLIADLIYGRLAGQR